MSLVTVVHATSVRRVWLIGRHRCSETILELGPAGEEERHPSTIGRTSPAGGASTVAPPVRTRPLTAIPESAQSAGASAAERPVGYVFKGAVGRTEDSTYAPNHVDAGRRAGNRADSGPDQHPLFLRVTLCQVCIGRPL